MALAICKHCLNPCKKFGKIDCKDYHNPTIEDLQKERKSLLDGSNTKRLKEIENKIDYINWGIL